MNRPLRFAYTLYCIIPFALSFLVVIPLYFLIFNFSEKEKAPSRAHSVSRGWARFLFASFFIRLKLKNTGVIKPEQLYVFIGNHRSFLDIPCYALACPHTFRFLSKAELAKIPLLGYVIKNLYITVNRSDKRDRHKSIEKMMESLRSGISVFLAPEGTRNTSGAPLLDFKDGAFRLAITAQLPLAVLVIHNSEKLLSPLRPLEMAPGTLDAEWLPPIDTKGMTEHDLEELKGKVRAGMEKVLLKDGRK